MTPHEIKEAAALLEELDSWRRAHDYFSERHVTGVEHDKVGGEGDLSPSTFKKLSLNRAVSWNDGGLIRAVSWNDEVGDYMTRALLTYFSNKVAEVRVRLQAIGITDLK